MFNPSQMTDHEVLMEVAQLVVRGDAAVRDVPVKSGELPWPQILTDLQRFEGSISHMYVDSKGYVTVGVGRMLPNATEAQKLGFVVRSTGVRATPEQIAADFAKVHAQPMNHLPGFYKSDLDLPQTEIDRVTKEIAERCDKEVSASYIGYGRYPVELRQVLIDMRYNMGGNMDNFKSFKKAVERANQVGNGEDWELAARESHRRDVSTERNRWTSDMILKAAGIKKR